MSEIIRYEKPRNWIDYRLDAVQKELIEAKAAIDTLNSLPFQKPWLRKLQEVELKREVAGTSRIEGAEFTERELDQAIKEDFAALKTRSQRQARAAKLAYEWISEQPLDRPVDEQVIRTIHEHMVRNADDDHVEPGALRKRDENVTFGIPKHRGVDGGKECDATFLEFAKMIATAFQEHDPVIQAHAAHYHFAAMHPFLDGNGRTARALESMMLQRAGLRNISFVALSNYYYEEKDRYLASLSEARAAGHDLTKFLRFCLVGVKQVCVRLTDEIHLELSKVLFRDTMYDMFNRLVGGKTRVIAIRQMEILKVMIELGSMNFDEFIARFRYLYSDLKNPDSALSRDISGLLALGALKMDDSFALDEGNAADLFVDTRKVILSVDYNWPEKISDGEFMKNLKSLPEAKTYPFLNRISKKREGR